MRSVASSDTPWTPGPWTAYGGNVWTGTDPEVEGHPLIAAHVPSGISGGGGWGPRVVMLPADAKLIALAPEMAEAILACSEFGYGLSKAHLNELAERLRGIGGRDD